MARRAVGAAAAALLLALSASACSGGGERYDRAAAAENEAGLAACRAAFGAANVDAVRGEFAEDGGRFRPSGPSPDRIRTKALAEARDWDRASDDFRRAFYGLCTLEGAWDDGPQEVSGSIRWSISTMDVTPPPGRLPRWGKVSEGVYLGSPVHRDRTLLMRCTVSGTGPEQAQWLPLEVSVRADGTSPELRDRLLASLARSTRALLGCREELTVPDDLTA
ncbi:hypothetical protein [Streptomyces sp. NPDC058667]|uniref:hypothetical protein n=1 Tax=Streptomyces sp. NPDC058667 TaxID=3346588 RepID=UPI003646458B